MIRQSGFIALSTPPACPRFVRTNGNLQKAKYHLRRKRRVSARRLSMEFQISQTSVRRIMKSDLELHLSKIVIEPLPSDYQKLKRKKFTN